MTCNVEFNVFIPKDIETNGYYLFVSYGVHEHPPPPLNKTPESIIESIREIISKIHDPTLTTYKSVLFVYYLKIDYILIINYLARFLQNPLLQDFCRRFNRQNITELYLSLVN